MKKRLANLDKHLLALTLVRAMFGFWIMMHGFAFPDYDIVAAEHYFSSLGLPGVLAIFVSGVEICGGFMLIIGLWTRLFAYTFLILLLGALVYGTQDAAMFGHWRTPGYQIELLLMAVIGYFAITGDSGYSTDKYLSRSKH